MDEQGGAVRIGDGERQAAVDALIAHREAGRLDPVEFEERQVAASRARTWAEIAPLFTDLPDPRPVGMPPMPVPSAYQPQPLEGQVVERPSGGLLGGVVPDRYRDTVMALTPFVALALFFVTHAWLWFLAIPVVAILLYGAEGKPDKRRRDRNRDRRC